MKPGIWIDSLPLIAGLFVATTAVIVAASWELLLDLLAERRAQRARKQIRIASSRHR